VEAVKRLARERRLALTLADPGPEDTPPTLLLNPERLAAGEDLVGFYQVPAYRSWDPSQVLFVSFAVFFAMILSDAGYAGVLGLLLAAYWRRLGESSGGRRWRVLAAVLVGSSVVWGILVGSYFGAGPPPGSIWARFKALDINDFDTMMRLSVGLGVAHLVIANAQQAYLAWGRRRAFVPIGWIGATVGGYVLWLGSTADSPAWTTLGQGLLIVGLAAVFVASSQRPVTGVKAALLRLLEGLQGLTRVTKAFGDALSYLRLFALGLASASLALTFNDLGRQVAAAVPGLGLLLQLLLLLIGHTLNLALALMSGVVHGLRLNFIEFYDWALSGEGYPFNPLRKKELGE
jgi:V/A-type H+-transporting ATPase subunit I